MNIRYIENNVMMIQGVAAGPAGPAIAGPKFGQGPH